MLAALIRSAETGSPREAGVNRTPLSSFTFTAPAMQGNSYDDRFFEETYQEYLVDLKSDQKLVKTDSNIDKDGWKESEKLFRDELEKEKGTSNKWPVYNMAASYLVHCANKKNVNALYEPVRRLVEDSSINQDRGETIEKLAGQLEELGEYEKAKSLLMRELKIEGRAQHLWETSSICMLIRLSDIHEKQGARGEAEKCLRQALVYAGNDQLKLTRCGGMNLRDVLCTLGLLLAGEKRYAEAETYLALRLELETKSEGNASFTRVYYMKELAAIYFALGKHARFRELRHEIEEMERHASSNDEHFKKEQFRASCRSLWRYRAWLDNHGVKGSARESLLKRTKHYLFFLTRCYGSTSMLELTDKAIAGERNTYKRSLEYYYNSEIVSQYLQAFDQFMWFLKTKTEQTRQYSTSSSNETSSPISVMFKDRLVS